MGGPKSEKVRGNKKEEEDRKKRREVEKDKEKKEKGKQSRANDKSAGQQQQQQQQQQQPIPTFEQSMGLGGPDVPDRQASLIDGSVSRGFANLEPGTGTRGEGQQQQQQQQQQQPQQQQEEVEDKTPKKPSVYSDGSLKQNKCYFWQTGGAGVYLARQEHTPDHER